MKKIQINERTRMILKTTMFVSLIAALFLGLFWLYNYTEYKKAFPELQRCNYTTTSQSEFACCFGCWTYYKKQNFSYDSVIDTCHCDDYMLWTLDNATIAEYNRYRGIQDYFPNYQNNTVYQNITVIGNSIFTPNDTSNWTNSSG